MLYLVFSSFMLPMSSLYQNCTKLDDYNLKNTNPSCDKTPYLRIYSLIFVYLETVLISEFVSHTTFLILFSFLVFLLYCKNNSCWVFSDLLFGWQRISLVNKWKRQTTYLIHFPQQCHSCQCSSSPLFLELMETWLIPPIGT